MHTLKAYNPNEYLIKWSPIMLGIGAKTEQLEFLCGYAEWYAHSQWSHSVKVYNPNKYCVPGLDDNLPIILKALIKTDLHTSNYMFGNRHHELGKVIEHAYYPMQMPIEHGEANIKYLTEKLSDNIIDAIEKMKTKENWMTLIGKNVTLDDLCMLNICGYNMFGQTVAIAAQ